MEKEQDQDFSFYIPQRTVFGAAQNILEKKFVSQFLRPDIIERVTNNVVGRIATSLEEITNISLYGFDSSSWLAPRDWSPILDFLYHEKIIAEPRFFFEQPYNDEPKFYLFGLKPFLGVEFAEVQMYTMGSSFDPEEARAKAVGEFLERYALLPLSQYRMEKASVAHLKKKGKRFLDPARVAGAFERGGETNNSLSEHAEFFWVKGKSLCEGKEILLPAQLAFWRYNPDTRSEPRIRESNSNGTAGMFSLKKALLAGIYELIQRDAFLIFWLNRIAPPRIILESIEDEEIKKILKVVHRYNLDVEILDITSDFGAPAFVSVLLGGAGERRRVTIGGGCGAKPEHAIKSSLMEALSLSYIVRKKDMVYTLHEPYRPFREDIGQQQRLLLWANPDMFPRFKWFISGETMSFDACKAKYQIPAADTRKELEFLTEKCKALGRGYEIYYYQANNSILRKLNYYAVQVIIPAIVPLYLHETYAPLGASRLKTVPPQLGYTAASFPESLPHPFS